MKAISLNIKSYIAIAIEPAIICHRISKMFGLGSKNIFSVSIISFFFFYKLLQFIVTIHPTCRYNQLRKILASSTELFKEDPQL